MTREEEGTWALQQAAAMQRQVQRERAELAQIRAQLDAREARLAARTVELQIADSSSSAHTPSPTLQTLPHVGSPAKLTLSHFRLFWRGLAVVRC